MATFCYTFGEVVMGAQKFRGKLLTQNIINNNNNNNIKREMWPFFLAA